MYVVVQIQERKAIASPMLVSASALALGAFLIFEGMIKSRPKAGESYPPSLGLVYIQHIMSGFST